MSYDIRVETVTPVPLAAVRRRVRPGDVATVWRPALDQVWAFLRANDGLWAGGHNVFVYHHPVPPNDEMVAEFGVEVAPRSSRQATLSLRTHPRARSRRRCMSARSGIVAAAHAAIESWRLAHGRTFRGISWETYGDWGDDPMKNEVRVSYLLEDAT